VAFVNKYLKNVYGKKQIDILVPDLKYLVHGGRISKFKGSMAKFFRLMTTVTLTDTKLDKFGVDNTFAKAIETVSLTCFDELRKGHAIKRIGIFTNEVCSSKYKYKVFCDAVTAKLQLLVSKNVQIEYFKLPAFIIAHTGPNYVGVAMEVV
jgi:fatty acid-binding protein DegV